MCFFLLLALDFNVISVYIFMTYGYEQEWALMVIVLEGGEKRRRSAIASCFSPLYANIGVFYYICVCHAKTIFIIPSVNK